MIFQRFEASCIHAHPWRNFHCEIRPPSVHTSPSFNALAAAPTTRLEARATTEVEARQPGSRSKRLKTTQSAVSGQLAPEEKTSCQSQTNDVSVGRSHGRWLQASASCFILTVSRCSAAILCHVITGYMKARPAITGQRRTDTDGLPVCSPHHAMQLAVDCDEWPISFTDAGAEFVTPILL